LRVADLELDQEASGRRIHTLPTSSPRCFRRAPALAPVRQDRHLAEAVGHPGGYRKIEKWSDADKGPIVESGPLNEVQDEA
jgi:hypothetical protein